MKLTFREYKEKVMGCWMGKNIGGVLGAPFEAKRGVFDIDFYTQDLSGDPPPNDDLDLQLVWLNAVEKYGRHINASILGEYWLSFIIPNWAEYGAGKNNLRMGFVPPLSGYLENEYRDSCGCFIRSEIWACLAPGYPELAARYAYEDAIVDHSHEGMYGEIFCAAVQSAAFIEKDKYRLIAIGLSYIPEDCGVTHAITTALEAYREGVGFKEARRRVMTAEPGSFGVQGSALDEIPDDVPIGKAGYDAPSNIGIMIIGWLYGEDDFGKSLTLANNCGEDTDCTCATLGAILGIIHGYSGIPEKWIKPIGDTISTMCIAKMHGGVVIPRTVTELTDRVLRLTPFFLGAELCDILAGPEGYTIKVPSADKLFCVKGDTHVKGVGNGGKPTRLSLPELLKQSPFIVDYRFPLFDAQVDYMGLPYLSPGETKKLKLTLSDNAELGHCSNQWLQVKWHTPDGVRVLPNASNGPLKPQYREQTVFEFEITADSPVDSKLELILSISANGRHSCGLIKIMYLSR